MLVDASLQSSADQDHLYDAFMILGVIAEVACVTGLLSRRTYWRFPVFVIYMIVTSAMDAIGTWSYLTSSTTKYWRVFLFAITIEHCLEVALMWEIITTLWREAALTETRRTRVLITVGIMATCVSVAFSATSVVVYSHVSPGVSIYLRADLGFSMFRTIMFMLILTFGRILGTGWRRLIVQICLCFAFFSVIDMLCQMTHEAIAMTLSQYRYFDAIECVRIGAWTVAVLFIWWHVVSERRDRQQVTQ